MAYSVNRIRNKSVVCIVSIVLGSIARKKIVPGTKVPTHSELTKQSLMIVRICQNHQYLHFQLFDSLCVRGSNKKP
jgi:hypothetical protein